MIRLVLLLIALAFPTLAAEKIVTGLSQNRVQINANFDGSNILIYGAVKREAPPPDGARMNVIVTLEGPSTPLVIRKKEYMVGIWLNRSSVSIGSAPSFYAVATTGKLSEILSETDNLRHSIALPQMIRAIGISSEAENAQDYVEALQRIRSKEDRYRLLENRVQLTDETLFRTDIALPANLADGNYKVRIFILRAGKVLDTQERFIIVRKAGLERYLYNLAHDQPFLYGVISLLMAAIAGWGASEAFRILRRR